MNYFDSQNPGLNDISNEARDEARNFSYVETLIKNGTEILAKNRMNSYEELDALSVHQIIERLERQSVED